MVYTTNTARGAHRPTPTLPRPSSAIRSERAASKNAEAAAGERPQGRWSGRCSAGQAAVQKDILAPSCTLRGPTPGLLLCDVILPKSAMLKVVFGALNRTRVGAFDADVRTSRSAFCRILKC